jgi:hypothetical protein
MRAGQPSAPEAIRRLKIAFLASRKGFLKVTGSLIQTALERGHEAVLVRDPGEQKPGEVSTGEDLGHWPNARVVDHRWGMPILPLLRTERVEALVGPSLHFVLKALRQEEDMTGARAAGVRLYSVDYALETLTSDPDAYRVIDTTFYATEYQRGLHWRLRRDHFDRVAGDVSLTERSAVSGSTMLDQLALVDRAAVRRRLGFGPDRPVVLLMSLKMAVPEPWRRHVWGGGPRLVRMARAFATGQGRLVPAIWTGNSYRRLALSLREFCRRNGAILVVKSRTKNRDPRFLSKSADLFVEGDEGVFPYTSIELMAIADLCVHFQSGAVLEAARAGVPSVSVRVPQSHLEEYPGHDEIFGGREGSLQRWAGLVWSMEHAEASSRLAALTLADFKIDPAARDRYIKRFVGFDDARASERVLDVIARGAGRL